MVNKMTNEFAEKVAEKITEIRGWTCDVREIKKNNESHTGIVIHMDSHGAIAPVVYVPDRIADLTWDDLSDDDVTDAAHEYIMAVSSAPGIPSGTGALLQAVMKDRSEVLKRVFFRLVNRDWNEDKDLVTRPVDGDLQYIYRIDVSDVTGQAGSTIRLEDRHLEISGITEDELFDAAYENTQKMFPGQIRDIADMLPEDIEGLPRDFAYVVSNVQLCGGACVITYPDIQRRLKTMLGENFVIIPSSVHECIVLNIPESMDEECLNDMVRQVNMAVVDPTEQLSDHIYRIVNGRLTSIGQEPALKEA